MRRIIRENRVENNRKRKEGKENGERDERKYFFNNKKWKEGKQRKWIIRENGIKSSRIWSGGKENEGLACKILRSKI